MKMSSFGQAVSAPSAQKEQSKQVQGDGFSSRLEKQQADTHSTESAADAVREAIEGAEEAEVFAGRMALGDGSREGDDEKSRQKREAMRQRRELALSALDAPPLIDKSLAATTQTNTAPSAPVVTESMLSQIVSDVQMSLYHPQQPMFQVRLKEGALKGLQFRIIQRPEGIQVIFLSDATEIRNTLRLHVDRLTKSLRDRGVVIREIDIRDPEEDERERRHQRQRESEQETAEEQTED